MSNYNAADYQACYRASIAGAGGIPMSDENKQEQRRPPIEPQWVLLAVTAFLTIIGLSFCFQPVQPPSACLPQGSVVTAGSAPPNVGVCPP
jgi:hypothetical protein